MNKGKFDEKDFEQNETLVDFDTFCQMSASFLKSGFIEWFIFGNASKGQALNIANAGTKVFNLEPIRLEDVYQTLPLQLNVNESLVLQIPVEDKDNINSAALELF